MITAPPLPAWAHTLRPTQEQAVDEITQRFAQGATVVVLDAPTGSGKTLCAELVRRRLDAAAIYMCVDRGLQDQVLRDFPYARVIKGRRNYPTLDAPQRHGPPEFLSADDCTGTGEAACKWCAVREACPYLVAKRAALRAGLAVLNTAYFLREANTAGGFAKRPLVVADEADRLEGALMNAVSVEVSERRVAEWRVGMLPAAATLAQARGWIDRVLEAIEEDLATLGSARGQTLSSLRRQRQLRTLRGKLAGLAEEVELGEWVFAVGEKTVTFKPIRVERFARTQLWPHAARWLLMSATVLNAGRLLKDLGIGPEDQWAVVRMPATFPAKSRPVYALAVASVTRDNEAQAVPRVVEAVRRIMAQHPAERILVHTVSFKLLRALREALGADPRTVWYEGADGRAGVLRDYLDRAAGVLFAPALDRGLDLPDDACRVVVVAKVPWPDLGDPQVRARTNAAGGQLWYTDQTLRSLVQMTGRGVRHAADYCTSYILDAQFGRLLDRHRAVLPPWWVEAVVQ